MAEMSVSAQCSTMKGHLYNFYYSSLRNGHPSVSWHSSSSGLYTGFRNHPWGHLAFTVGLGAVLGKQFLNPDVSTLEESLK